MGLIDIWVPFWGVLKILGGWDSALSALSHRYCIPIFGIVLPYQPGSTTNNDQIGHTSSLNLGDMGPPQTPGFSANIHRYTKNLPSGKLT